VGTLGYNAGLYNDGYALTGFGSPIFSIINTINYFKVFDIKNSVFSRLHPKYTQVTKNQLAAIITCIRSTNWIDEMTISNVTVKESLFEYGRGYFAVGAS